MVARGPLKEELKVRASSVCEREGRAGHYLPVAGLDGECCFFQLLVELLRTYLLAGICDSEGPF